METRKAQAPGLQGFPNRKAPLPLECPSRLGLDLAPGRGVLRTRSVTSQVGKRLFQLPASSFPASAARRWAISFLVQL